jgi:hypothetical protein
MEDNQKLTLPNMTKLLILKKIELNKYPIFSKNLKEFFWNRDKYFQPKYKDHYIVIGNKDNTKSKKNSTIKRKINRRQTRRNVTLTISTDKRNLNESRRCSINDNNRRKGSSIKNVKETELKVGQKYINDYELEELFNMFQKVQKMNRKKVDNFIMAKEYIDNNSLILRTKTSKFIPQIKKSQNQVIKKENEILLDMGSSQNLKKVSNQKNNSNSNINLNMDYYKTTSTFSSVHNIKDGKDSKEENDNYNTNETPNNNIFCSISKINSLNSPINNYRTPSREHKFRTAKNFFRVKNLYDKRILSRNNMIKKQNQFLSECKEDNYIPNKSQKKIFAELLANQEQAILKIKSNKLKTNNLCKTLSEKTHRNKESLLINNTDSYRVKNELKNKFRFLNTKLAPEYIYNWTKDLRKDFQINKSKNIKINLNLYSDDENDTHKVTIDSYNIRSPYNKTMYNISKKRSFGKKKDMKYFRNLIDETNNINKNFEGLFVNGKNLLSLEYEQTKNLKNKKIINNYEIYLPSSDTEDVVFTDKKYTIENKGKKSIE